MSMRRLPSPAISPEVYARSLGQLIRTARLSDGRSIAELASQAGLTVAEWEQIEAGQGQPPCWGLVLWIARMLNLGRSWIPYLARAYAGIQQIEI